MVECKTLAIRRPPESPVTGRTAQDFLVIHPGGIAVHYRRRPIKGQATFLPVRDGDHIQVVRAGKSEHRGIRRIRQVHGTFRPKREIGELLRCLHARHLRTLGHHQFETGVVGVHHVVGECHFLVTQPLVGIWHPAGLLGGCGSDKDRKGHGYNQFLHINSSFLKFTRYTFSTARVRAVYSHFKSSGVRKSCQKGLSMNTQRHWPPCDL